MSEGVWSVITMRPSRVTSEELGQPAYVRQCRVLARAKSRVDFARRLIAAGLDNRSEAAVSAWLRDWGGKTSNRADLDAVVDEHIYVTALDGRPGSSYVRYPVAAS